MGLWTSGRLIEDNAYRRCGFRPTYFSVGDVRLDETDNTAMNLTVSVEKNGVLRKMENVVCVFRKIRYLLYEDVSSKSLDIPARG